MRMKYERVCKCKPGDVIGVDVQSTDGFIIVQGGTVLDNFYISLLNTYGIPRVNICSTDKEARHLSNVNIRFNKSDIRSKSYATHFVSEILNEPKVKLLYKTMTPDLVQHQINVAILTTMVLESVQYNMVGAGKNIVKGALLHDIGKLEVPSTILDVKRKLTDDEMSVVKLHTRVGFSMLYEMGFDLSICDIALKHHENSNGTGYPSKMYGCEIPYGARVVHVCDVYEALCAERPYKDPLNRREVRNIMLGMRESFDQDILCTFMDLMPDYFINDIIIYNNTALKVISYTDGRKPVLRNIVTLEECTLDELEEDKIQPCSLNLIDRKENYL